MPLTKKPNAVVAFPPAEFASAHRVADGDNWWTIRDRYGLKDVWDVIAFNFNTYDPKEVNWYLKNAVGCTLTTADGKNYRFSSAASPGVIYIPNPNWKAGGKLGKSPSGGDGPAPDDHSGESADPDAPLSPDDLRSKASALVTINTAKSRHMRFIVPDFNYEVNAGKLQSVYFYLEQEFIRTRYRPKVGKFAKYFIGGNEMHLGFKEMYAGEESGLVVHEAIHAMMDIEGRPILDKHSEAAAYIAQMYYMLLVDASYGELPPGLTPEQIRIAKGGAGVHIPQRRPRNYTQEIFTHAWYIAMSLIYRRPDMNPGHPEKDRYTIDNVRFRQLLAAIEGDPDYKKHANHNSGYNGVSRTKPRPA